MQHNATFQWITTDAQLATLCRQCCTLTAIALDTEFIRRTSFYPHVGLLQINTGQHCYLIDPLTITDFSPLTTLLTHAATTKVLHACSEDLDVFRYMLGCVPQPLFDTQVAASFLDYGLSVSYQDLVESVLGMALEKSETCSDWLQRPLTQQQAHYASLDVYYLLPMYQQLVKQLNDAARLDWVRNECDQLQLGRSSIIGDPTIYYQQVKAAWRLRPQQLMVLQRLTAWREQTIRERDIPRNFLLTDKALCSLAVRQPSSYNGLVALNELHPRVLRRDGKQLLAIIAQAKRVPRAAWPTPLPTPLPREAGALSKLIKRIAKQAADQHQVPLELIIRKRDIDVILRGLYKQQHVVLPDSMQGWRYLLIGEPLQELAADYLDFINEEQKNHLLDL